MRPVRILDSLMFLYDRVINPELVDFTRMGLGIKSRYHEAKSEWASHIRSSIELQLSALSRVPPQSNVAILGAGRLFDVPTSELRKRRFSVSLYDLDPGAVRSWSVHFLLARLYGVHWRGELFDLSGVLQKWTELISQALLTKGTDSFNALNAALEDCLLMPKSEITLRDYDVVVSLNLLSQIPLYWRDRVLSRIERTLGTDPTKIPPATSEKIYLTMEHLQRAHLELLTKINSKYVVLITDTRFIAGASLNELQLSNGRGGVGSRLPPEAEETPALLTPSTLRSNSYNLIEERTWLWNLLPSKNKARVLPEINEVRGQVFERVRS